MSNIYGKLAEARKAFHALDLKKSGKNTFAGYKYFELGDFIVPGMDCMRDAGLVPVVTFEAERAVMRVFEVDGDGSFEIESPRAVANLKGCHPIQNLGAEETYQRRYLWMAALEIVEHDAVDASQPGKATKASDDQLEAVATLIEETGTDNAKLCGYFQVKDIADLTSEQANAAAQMLQKKKTS